MQSEAPLLAHQKELSMPDDRLGWLRWVLTPGLGLKRCHQLLNLVDSPDDLFAHPDRWPLPESIRSTLREVQYLGEQHPIHRRALEQIRWAEAEGHHLVSFQCEHYPELLNQIDDPPLMLWVNGNPALLNQPQVGVVGSRSASLSARRNAQTLGRDISRAGLVITSGGAAGIDGCAHEGALESGGCTIAVLGCGVDVVYPRHHRPLFERIAQQGALVSEHPLGTQPKPGHFPRRNRIISGLSDAVVVVEAAVRSGSLITADHALDQGRDVYAIPGDINNPNAAGCHRLIQDGAYLLSRAEDLLDSLHPCHQATALQSAPAAELKPELPDTQLRLLSLLSADPQPLDVLSDVMACPSHTLLEPLLELELGGWIQQQPGGYSRL